MLVTAAEVVAQIPSLTGTGEDTLLGTLITAIGDLFARRCGYPEASPGAPPTMESTTYVLDLPSPDPRELDLQVYPVASISSAITDVLGDFSGSELVVPLADIQLRDGRRARLITSSTSVWLPSAQNRVTFVAGYGGASTVNGAHNSSVTTITVVSTAAFTTDRSGGGRVVVGTEVIRFTAKTATTLTGCTRGAEGTTAASITTGTAISQPIPSALKKLAIDAVRAFFDRRQTQGMASTSTNGNAATFRDEDLLPAFVDAGLGAFVLPRAML